jgi:hypothetical protein
MSRGASRAAVVASLFMCGALAGAEASVAAPAVECRYVEAGEAGPRGNELRITVRSHRYLVRIRRFDSAIGVYSVSTSTGASSSTGASAGRVSVAGANLRSLGGTSRAISCLGGAPDITNVDLIDISGPVDRIRNTWFSNPNALIDAGGGRLAPGATDEGDGSSEIEVAVRATGHDGFPLAGVLGTSGADRFRLGTKQDWAGANLNPDEATPDVDLRVQADQIGDEFLGIFSKGGADRVSAAGGSEFDGRLTGGLLASLGPGDDRLRGGGGFSFAFGGRGHDQLRLGRGNGGLKGGAGRDLLIGGRYGDQLDGGLGRDVIQAGAGDDAVRTNDGWRDRIRCGRGRDKLLADSRDRQRGCERIRRRRARR